MPVCMVNTCRYSWRKRDSEIALHVFPRDPERIRQWLKSIHTPVSQLDTLAIKIAGDRNCTYRLCSKHFTPESYESRGFCQYLRKNAVPTLELGSPQMDIEEFCLEHNYADRSGLHVGEIDTVQAMHDALSTAPHSSFDCDTSTFATTYAATQDNLVNEVILDITVDYSSSDAETPSTFLEQEINIPAAPKKRRKKSAPVKANVCVGTEPPELRHCATAIHRSLISRKVGVQCNLARLPPIQRFPVKPHPQPFQGVQNINSCNQNPTESGTPTSIVKYEEGRRLTPQGVRAASLSTILGDPCKNASMFGKTLSVRENSSGQTTDKNYATAFDEYQNETGKNKDQEDIDTSRVVMIEEDENSDLASEAKFIVYESCLNKLFFLCRCPSTTFCNAKIVKIKKFRIGSAISITSFCANKHEGQLWSSQPFIGSMPAGNLLVSSGTLLSGNNFAKIQSFFNVVGLLGISAATHCKNQASFLYPAIDCFWRKERKKLLDDLKHKPVALAGDWHCDPIEGSTKFCTYSMFDCASKKIVDFQVQQLVPSVSCVAMEKKACKIVLDRLLRNNLNVRLLCTDRHVGIRKMMRLKYTNLKHQFDIWHVAKSIEIELQQARKSKDCRAISSWITATKHHLWWAARTCQGNAELLKEKWLSICRHVINEHQWNDCVYYVACDHPPVEYAKGHQRKWLPKGSPAHFRFLEVVGDKKLLNDLEHLYHFWHADEIEVYHSTALKYCSKRSHCFTDGMIARTQLAILDYNHNIGRLFKSMTRSSDGLGGVGKVYKMDELPSRDFKRNLLKLIFLLAERQLASS